LHFSKGYGILSLFYSYIFSITALGGLMQLPFLSHSQEFSASIHDMAEALIQELHSFLTTSHDTLSIDRFEDGFAICENQKTGKMEDIPLSQIDRNAREGDILSFQNGKYVVSNQLTTSAQKEVNDLLQHNQKLS